MESSTVTVAGVSARAWPADGRMALALFVGFWALYCAVHQAPFPLQGAVLENLVERGRLRFESGRITDRGFENSETRTPSFRILCNVFPAGRCFRVNHAPGQFLLAAPWYAACVRLGYRFSTCEHLVWWLLQLTLVAPLAALAVACVYRLARRLGRTQGEALAAALALGLASPWWGAGSVLYHDSMAVALVLIACDLWLAAAGRNGVGSWLRTAVAGVLLGWSVFTTYLVVPVVGVLLVAMITARRSLGAAGALLAGFLPVVALLPLSNLLAYGSLLQTGYSAGGFDSNYPRPLDVANLLEKLYFYLLSPLHGLLFLFPVFGFGMVNLAHGRDLAPSTRLALATVAGAQLLFSVTIPHHGSLGWGVGRFILPVFPVLALAVPGPTALNGWAKGFWRALLVATFLYSAVHGWAAVWYGAHAFGAGYSLPSGLTARWGELYLVLPLLCLGCGYLAVGAATRRGGR